MRTHRPHRPTGNRRRGFKLLDLLVVIVCLGILAALIVPALRSPHIAAHRMQCMSNLHNLGIAAANYQSNNNDRLPLLEDGTNGWPITLLPLLDSAALYRQIRTNRESVLPAGSVPNVALRFFTCPDDANNFRVPGGLSYAANAGYIRADHWGGDPAVYGSAHEAGTLTFPGSDRSQDVALRDVHYASGVFWRPGAFRMTGDFIARSDGLAHTLLFVENAQATNWGSRHTGDIAFGLSVAAGPDGDPNARYPTGRIGVPGPNAAVESALALQPGFALTDGGGADNAAINANVGTVAPGRAPRPGSLHAGKLVNVAFCDGRAQALSEKIDATVYARLITPAGEKHGQQPVESEAIE